MEIYISMNASKEIKLEYFVLFIKNYLILNIFYIFARIFVYFCVWCISHKYTNHKYKNPLFKHNNERIDIQKAIFSLVPGTLLRRD